MEKLSPILAFYVADGLVKGAERSYEILRYGGMGHTAGTHTRSREAAVKFGAEMPASRITVNTPTTHGAIGFSTALPPSMTLGCGSWGGNVTSDNVSPLHLLDIKRVAFETRPVKSARPAVGASTASTASVSSSPPPARQPQPVAGQAGKINREEIAAIVDKFLANRTPDELPTRRIAPQPAPPPVEAEAGSMYVGPSQRSSQGNGESTPARPAAPPATASANGNKTVDFVSEDDVKRAIQKGEKIYINAKTIITPAARDIGEPAEVFAKA
jgi:acetaldehyde dehydrogenase (acetylating)